LISGVRIGKAPVEDFAYPLAGAMLLPALWQLLQKPVQRKEVTAADGGVAGNSALVGNGARTETSAIAGSDVRAGTSVEKSALGALFWVSRPISWINTAYPFAVAVVLTTGA